MKDKNRNEIKGKGNKLKKMIIKMININLVIAIITLNFNGLNATIKRQRLSEWLNKCD